ncbi:sulfotransferase family protein [Flavimaricola marinus]|uniref:Sulfotransferase family protein n=1 Tax=Flavimaricola marinus TaxID=1819565 RepID=A0A238LK71_9RHOB|nr:sulfotransferase family protein [Flavimaricola marinus]SMY09270.1 hypothetical protein LOM8899_03435 [Flavimaricola marinus]
MTLDIIGAGFGRTGTSSIAKALGILGYPCYHMTDVMFHPDHKSDVDFWLDVMKDPDSPDRDWNRVFAGKRATLDFPACAAWRGMARAFPEAKVLLSVHAKGPEGWYDSTMGTIYKGTGLPSESEFGAKMNTMLDGLIWNGLLQGTMDHRDLAIARYEAHIAEVRAEIAPERLIVFRADEGWNRLCSFLGEPMPQAAFPNVNNRAEMGRRMKRLEKIARMHAA